MEMVDNGENMLMHADALSRHSRAWTETSVKSFCAAPLQEVKPSLEGGADEKDPARPMKSVTIRSRMKQLKK